VTESFTAESEKEALHSHHTKVATASRLRGRTPREALVRKEAATRTVGDLLDEWVAELDLPGSSHRPNTITAHKDRVKSLRTALGHVLLTQLDTRAINDVTRRWLTGGARGRVMSPRTVKANMSTLRIALKYGESLGYCTTEAIDKARKSSSRTKVGLIPDSDMRKILQAARADGEGLPMHLFVELIAATGCRRGEALGLRWGDIDFDNGTVRIERSRNPHGVGPVKTDNGYRLVDLPPQLVKFLKRRRGAPDAYVVDVVPATINRGNGERSATTSALITHHTRFGTPSPAAMSMTRGSPSLKLPESWATRS